MNVKNSLFDGNQGFDGGTFYIENQATVTLETIQVKNSLTVNNGGMLYALMTSASTGTVTITNPTSIQTISTISSKNDGGGFYINHPGLEIYLVKVIGDSVQTIGAGSRGGVFFV